MMEFGNTRPEKAPNAIKLRGGMPDNGNDFATLARSNACAELPEGLG
jgi:hypothetical protein